MNDSKRIGEYELLEVLGRGSFGTVWEARHVTLNRPTALKILNPQVSSLKESERFIREAQIAGRLKHPNIVRLLEAGKTSESSGKVEFLCYELIEGVTLADWSQFTSLSHQEIAVLFEKVASALEYAHQNGIVHRDLKPENILVDLAGEPHITDFGLARKLDDRLTETNITLGTIAYMSPEQARGASNEADSRSDVFSVGAMLFEVLTQRLPFDAENIPAYLFAVTNSTARAPNETDASIPKDLSTICEKCLRSGAKDRYQNAAALADDLRRFIEGIPIAARPVSVAERLQSWCIRKPIAATLIGLLSLVSILGPLTAIRQIALRRDLLEQTRNLDTSNSDLRTSKYNNDLYLAYQTWNEGRIQETRSVLDRAIPERGEKDLREFAWQLLNDRVDTAYEVVAQSANPINQILLSQNEQHLLVSDQSKQLSIWDFPKRKFSKAIPLIETGHHAIALLEDLVLVGDRVGDDVTGRPVLCAYDFHSAERKHTISLDAENNIETIAISPSKELIAIGVRNDGIYFYDKVFKPAGYVQNHGRHHNLAFSPNGRWLVATQHNRGAQQNAVVTIDVDRKVIGQKHSYNSKSRTAIWRGDGEYIAFHKEFGRGHLLQVPQLNKVGSISTHPTTLFSLDFHPDGRTLVGGGEDGSIISQHVNFHTDACNVINYLPHTGRVIAVHSMPDESVLSASKDGTVILTAPNQIVSQGSSIAAESGYESIMLCSHPSGRIFIGSADGILKTRTGETLRSFEVPICSLAISQDETQLACGLADGSIALLETTGFTTQKIVPGLDLGKVRELVLYENAKRVVAVYESSVIQFYDLKNDRLIAAQEVVNGNARLALSEKQGLLFASAAGEFIQAYRLFDGQQEFQLATDETQSLAAHPDQPLLFTGHYDHSIRVWNTDKQRLESVLRGHRGGVGALALHADGEILASAGDNQIRLWHVPSQTAIGTAFQGLSKRSISQIAFEPGKASLLARVLYRGLPDQIYRIGAPFNSPDFKRYTVPPSQLSHSSNVTTKLVSQQQPPKPYLEVSTKGDRSDCYIGTWLDERCKGKQARVTFYASVIRGGAKASVDHYSCADRHSTKTPQWHGASHVHLTSPEQQAIQTDWVRITHGEWAAVKDASAKPYKATLHLNKNSLVRLHSVCIECRDVQ